MKKYFLISLLAAACLPLSANAIGLLSYKPPEPSVASQVHSTGGTRGLAAASQVQILAPKDTALTNQSQPILYWYQPSKIKLKAVKISLAKFGDSQPLLTTNIPATTGLQRFALADSHTFLENNVEYTWTISLIDKKGKERNELSANLRYQEPVTPLLTMEDKAQAGYWYDVLQTLIESKSPQTEAFLKQVGILVPALF